MLFCIGLIALGPLLTIGSLATSFSESAGLFEKFPGLLIITVIDTIISIGIMAFSICAGVGLLRIQPHAVQVAKIYLLCLLGYQIVAAILPFLAGLPAEANENMIAPVAISSFKGVVYVAIWYSYLNKSERVRATYAN